MADIELVIKISEEIKAVIDKNGTNENVTETLWQATKNGTPLPKGHGRLKDIDWIDDNCESHHSDIDGSWCYTWRDIDDAPTIIEADKENK